MESENLELNQQVGELGRALGQEAAAYQAQVMVFGGGDFGDDVGNGGSGVGDGGGIGDHLSFVGHLDKRPLHIRPR